jgi:hypothetical protein
MGELRKNGAQTLKADDIVAAAVLITLKMLDVYTGDGGEIVIDVKPECR